MPKTNILDQPLPISWLNPVSRNGRTILPSRVIPGPMEGIMSESFCHAMVQRNLVDCWLTPFIRISEGVPRRTRLQKRMQPFLTASAPPVVQIMGCNSQLLAETAARLMNLGAAGVDLNCACPSPIVVRNGAGAALLQNPDWIYRTLNGMRAACTDGSISVKLRTGLQSPQEMKQVLAAVQAVDVDLVILHFRTASELYEPVPNGLERLARARELLPDKVLIGSGDIFSVGNAKHMHQVAGVDGILVARGLLRNPWLLREIQAFCKGQELTGKPNKIEKIQLLLDIADSARNSNIRRHGFIILLAQELVAAEHAIIHELKRLSNLSEVCIYLKSQLDQFDHQTTGMQENK